MSNFSKLRELVTTARTLEREARRMKASNPAGYRDRMREAEWYTVKALHLAGRITEVAFQRYIEERMSQIGW